MKGYCGAYVALIPLLAIGCGPGRVETDQAPDDENVDRGMFGDPYEIVGNFSPADPDLYPILSGDTLTVRLTYAGGCETHEFDVRHEVRGDSAFIWLQHDAQNDNCEALIQDEVQAVLPGDVAGSEVVSILHPQGGPPQILGH